MVALFLKDSPKEKGLLPDGGVDLLAQSEERPEKQGLTWSAARSSSTFWLLVCGFSLVGASVHACVIHLVSMLTDRGISAENAALASSALGISTVRAQQKSLTSEQKQVVDTVSTIFTAARTDDVPKFDSVMPFTYSTEAPDSTATPS